MERNGWVKGLPTAPRRAMADGGVPFYIVCEDEVHRALAMALTDAVIVRVAPGVSIEKARRWSAIEERESVP